MMLSKILIPFLFLSILNAGTYDDNYRVTEINSTIHENDNTFMKGNFESIIRYDMLNMNENQDNNASAKLVDKVKNKIQELQTAITEKIAELNQ